jgi:hypothetical protein
MESISDLYYINKNKLVMNNEQKHTQQLVDQFRNSLLQRRDYIWDMEDKLEEMFDGDDLISFQNAHSMEVDRIENIFKLLEKGKI